METIENKRLLTDEDVERLSRECPTLDFSCVDDYLQEFTEICKAQDAKTIKAVFERLDDLRRIYGNLIPDVKWQSLMEELLNGH
jgi:hypothetical protein